MEAIRRTIMPLVTFILAWGALIGISPSIHPELNPTEVQSSPIKPPPLGTIKPSVLNIMTMGYRNIYEDFSHLWMIQTLMTPYDINLREDMMQAIRLVIQHKPRIESFYMLSCFVMAQEFRAPQHCQEIIKIGLEAFPQSWRLPMTQGFIHAFLLKEPAQASAFFTIAASRENSPPYVAKVAEKLIHKEDLNIDDLTKSVELLMNTPYESRFREMLKNIPVHEPSEGAGNLNPTPNGNETYLNPENAPINIMKQGGDHE